MGGQAFAGIDILVPRLPPTIYEDVKKIALKAVSKHYAKVAAIPEAPGKEDYGDVDLAVESPHSPSALQDIVRDLPALHVKENFPNYHLAISLAMTQDHNTEDSNTEDSNSNTEYSKSNTEHSNSNTENFNTEDIATEDINTENINTEDINTENINTENINPENINTENINTEDFNKSNGNTQDRNTQDCTFAQVDIRVCPSGHFDWILFLHGHGDLGQILGVMNYGYGFTANDKGFHVRIKEQEAQNWRASLVFLTKDPGMLMDFVHLDKQEFAKGFQSEQELFSWLSTCRLLDRNLVETRKDDSDDRARMQKRPMFRRFVSEYLPSLPSCQATSTHTRESLLQEALIFFNKGEEYTQRRNIVLSANAEEHAWDLIASTVLQPDAGLQKSKLNEVVRAFKRFVAFTADQPYIREEPEMDPDRQAQFCVMINEHDEVDSEMRRWLLDNWQEVKALERERVKEKRRLAMKTG